MNRSIFTTDSTAHLRIAIVGLAALLLIAVVRVFV
jgi:hypothetical protein